MPGLFRPAARFGGLRQDLCGQRAVAVEQLGGIAQDRRSLAQQRVRHLVGQLLALGLAGHVALVVLQAVITTVFGQRIERQAQALAFGLAELALGLVLVTLGAALGLVQADPLLVALGAELLRVGGRVPGRAGGNGSPGR